MKEFFNLIIAKDKAELCQLTLKTWWELARRAIAQHGRFTAAISGGQSPVDFYRTLSLSLFDYAGAW